MGIVRDFWLCGSPFSLSQMCLSERANEIAYTVKILKWLEAEMGNSNSELELTLELTFYSVELELELEWNFKKVEWNWSKSYLTWSLSWSGVISFHMELESEWSC